MVSFFTLQHVDFVVVLHEHRMAVTIISVVNFMFYYFKVDYSIGSDGLGI